jgi:predicted Zn-dependent protease with MMP-like domain
VSDDEFTAWVEEALAGLPPELASRVENVWIEISDEEPPRRGILGLYRGVPRTRRGSGYVRALPDRITIYRRPLERLYGRDRELLAERVRHVVRHELAHHFGISDERLRELGRY